MNQQKYNWGTIQKPFKNSETFLLVLSLPEFLDGLQDFSQSPKVYRSLWVDSENWRSNSHHLSLSQAQSAERNKLQKIIFFQGGVEGWCLEGNTSSQEYLKSVDQLKLILLTCLLLIMPVTISFPGKRKDTLPGNTRLPQLWWGTRDECGLGERGGKMQREGSMVVGLFILLLNTDHKVLRYNRNI